MISDKHRFIFTKIGKTGGTSIQKTLERIDGKFRSLGHHHLIDDITEKTKKYFKFTFVRNPWARCVSRFFYESAKEERGRVWRELGFDEFIRAKGPPYEVGDERKFFLRTWKCSPHLERICDKYHPYENQIDWISSEEGEILTDFIGRVETMQEDFNIVCDKIGIERQQLPHQNKSKHKHYTEYYDDETREIVAEKFAKDIEYFGYDFGE